MENLRKSLRKGLRNCNTNKKKIESTVDRLNNIFNSDQIQYLKTGNARGQAWSADTMKNALKLYMACGTKGYEEIIRQNLPYPSVRTIHNRLRNIKFSAGIVEDVFVLLQHKVCGVNLYFVRL